MNVVVSGTESLILTIASIAALVAAIVTGLIAWRRRR
jgi:hypothetical protein